MLLSDRWTKCYNLSVAGVLKVVLRQCLFSNQVETTELIFLGAPCSWRRWTLFHIYLAFAGIQRPMIHAILSVFGSVPCLAVIWCASTLFHCWYWFVTWSFFYMEQLLQCLRAWWPISLVYSSGSALKCIHATRLFDSRKSMLSCANHTNW